jgi:O-antigen/teichoic acid export membrane protein
MFETLKKPLYRLLRSTEKYTKTDMVHFFSANFWLNFSRIISVGTGMTLTVAFANLLTPEQFGTYKYVIAAAGLFATFSLNGLTIAVTRAAAQGKFHVIPAVVRSGALWSMPASIAAFGVSVYYFSQGNNDLGFAFLFIAINNSFSNGIGTTKGVWFAAGKFKVGTLLGLPKIIVPFIIILLTIVITENIVWILLAYFLSNLLLSFFGYWLMEWWFKIKKSKEDVSDTIKFGKQMTVLGFLQLASGQIDQLLLWHFVGPVGLATYALALGPVREAQGLLNNFLTVLFPKIASKTESEVHTTLPTRLWQMFFVSAALTVLYIATVPFLFTYLFPKYMAAVVVSQVLALTILFQLKGIVDVFFTAHGKVWDRSRVILISQAIEFGLFLGLIPFLGLWGAVTATVLSEIVAAIIYILIYIKARSESKKKELGL